MINSLKVEGLNRRFDYNLKFNEDMNVLTGLNGSGKTTLLKLLWYLISGNLHRITSEILFDSVESKTSWFDLYMKKESKNTVKLTWNNLKTPDELQSENGTLEVKNPADNLDELKKLNEKIAKVVQGSLFFPTFRRCELGERGFGDESSYGKLRHAMEEFSSELSVEEKHKFITTMSTGDIAPRLRPIVKLIEELQSLEDSAKQPVQERIQHELKEQFSVLWNITEGNIQELEKTFQERFSLLRDIVRDIYNLYQEITISIDISFEGKGEGKGNWEISSEDLSSGEKQLLGFLCHNAFSDHVLMFLDEPELSLHIDYQRLILSLLEAQGGEKQFFVATHSPSIYSRYPNHEINLEENTNESKS